ncbi:MAG: ACT domain-containing protein [Myxococcota bacterium]
MNHQLLIHLRSVEGALVRTLGLVERRGYATQRVSAVPVGTHTTMLQLTVSAQRPIDKLIHQLRKLYDVQHVEITT